MKTLRPSRFYLLKKRLQRRYFGKRFSFVHLQLTSLSVFTAGIVIGLSLLVNQFVIPKIFAVDEYDWDFATAGNFTVSNSGLIEVVSNAVKLKIRQYSSDASTALLMHFDESSGTATDSSSHAHSTTSTNLTYGTGNFFNGGDFNGSTSKVAMADSSALSLSQAHTIEGWVKFDETFSQATSGKHQYLVDKGDYKLYFDNETGKLTYQLNPNTTPSWSQVGGAEVNNSWNTSTTALRNVNEVSYMGTDLYAGTGSIVGDAEVWRMRDGTWSKIGGDGTGWAAGTYEEVTAMANDGTNVYVGLGTGGSRGEVWMWNGSTWSSIGGASNFGAGIEQVLTMAIYDSKLHVGLGNTVDEADVWRFDNPGWTQVGGTAGVSSVNSSWTDAGNYETVYAMVANDDYLFVGLGLTADDSEVYRWDGATWTHVGGTAGTSTVNSSWTDADNIEYVLSLAIDDTYLYAGTGVSANASGDDDAEVWQMDLSNNTWSQIGGNGVNSAGWTAALNYEGVWSLAVVGGELVAGVGNTADEGDLWRYSGGSWTQIGGTNGTTTINSGWTATDDVTIVRDFSVSGDNVYIALNATADGGEVWRWDNAGDTFTKLGGNHLNKSWGYFGQETVKTIATHNGNMYAGLGTNVTTYGGDAQVWEYNGSSWTMIGGQGINSSWPADTIETVNTMISYEGNLYVGLGSSTTATTDDGQVWRWNGTTWTQVGGHGSSGFGGWVDADNIENVYAFAVDDDYLYAGTGMSVNTGSPSRDDGQVWRFDGDTWTQIGGNNSSGTTLNSGWGNADNIESVLTLIHDGEYLYAGLGITASDGDVWRWNGTAWTQIGGTQGVNTVNSGWTNADGIEGVYSMTLSNSELYVGLGASTGDAEVWSWNGTTWTQVGGTNSGLEVVNDSWQIGTYESVTAIEAYNGAIYAGLGNNAATDGEIWRFDGTQWDLVGGDTGTWSTTIEQVWTLAEYKGKLYAGLGNTSNTDAQVWAYGNNAFLASDTDEFDTNWHYVVATYDGSTMKLYIDDVNTADASTAVSLTINDSSNGLLVGNSHDSHNAGKAAGGFEGLIDELRISSVVRSASDLNSTPYSASGQTVQPAAAVLTAGVQTFSGFSTAESGGGTIRYRLSSDGGTTWKYWDGDSWETSSNTTSHVNTASDVNTNINDFTIGSGGLLWQAVLTGNGNEQVTLSDPLTVTYTGDSTAPTNPDTLTALSASGGSALTTNTWYTHTAPYFSWSGASDAGAGIAGYYVYFGTDNTAEPTTAGAFQAGATYTASSLTSGQTYYLRIKARDSAQNTASTTWEAFTYKLDTTTPSNPTTVSVSPAGYAPTNSFTFSWPSSGANAASDAGSGIAGYQYKTATASGSLSDWSETTTSTSIEIANAAYQTGENTFYLRAIDTAGNVSGTPVTTNYYFAGEGPSAPQFLTVTPSTNTTNSFGFSWSIPSSYSGESSELTYCYTINTLPNADNCTFTSPGATSISASSFATQVGLNTVYMVSKNSEDSGGAINYGTYASATFTANTSAPGIPKNIDIADISIKSSETWRLTVSWNTPDDVGSGVEEYAIYRSTDGETYSELSTTTGSAFVDTNLEEQLYYYKVKACDSVNNCGAFSSAVSLLPTGKYIEPANLSSGPTVSSITTKQATIDWTTDRASDTKVQYGTGSGSYFSSEPSNSTQTTAHEIALTNLTPGTTYYYKAKWTDEDGNTGMSGEKTFTTEPAPVVTDPKAKTISLDSVALEYKVSGASKVKIYYGETSGFGGIKEVSTSTAETTYTTVLEELKDGTKYFYKINSVDSEGAEYEGNVLSFETLPRPKIATVRIQQVRGTAQPTVLVTWNTNTEVSSIVTFAPEGNPSAAKDEVNVALVRGQHKMIIRQLLSDTPYILVVRGRDKAGNEAVSEAQKFTTATDTRPAQISGLKVEGTNLKTGETPISQLVVSWTTDEPATSQVEFGEGTGTTYSQKTQEDANLKTNHLVIISNLTPSKVYHLRALSKDSAGNEGQSIDTVTITPKASDNALNLVVNNLQQVFGFLGK